MNYFGRVCLNRATYIICKTAFEVSAVEVLAIDILDKFFL